MPAFIDIPPAARQQIDAILTHVEKARRALQSRAVLPHVQEEAKASLKKAAHASFALARTL